MKLKRMTAIFTIPMRVQTLNEMTEYKKKQRQQQ